MTYDEVWLLTAVAAVIALVSFGAGVLAANATMSVRVAKRQLRELPAEDPAAASAPQPAAAYGPSPYELTLTMATVAEQDVTAVLADFPAPASGDPTAERMISDPAYEPVERDARTIVAEALEPNRVDETAMQAALDAALRLEAEGHGEEPPRLDLADLHDVYGDDEDGETGDEPGEEPPSPPAGGGDPLCSEALLPARSAYDWSLAKPVPAGYGVTPNRYAMYRWRLRTWWNRQRHEAAALRQMEARGFQPGEATALVHSGVSLPTLTPDRRTRRRHVGGHRPEVVHLRMPCAIRPQPRRVLRADWRDFLRPPRRTNASSPMIGGAL